MLSEIEVPTPVPGPRDLLVRVKAVSVNLLMSNAEGAKIRLPHLDIACWVMTLLGSWKTLGTK